MRTLIADGQLIRSRGAWTWAVLVAAAGTPNRAGFANASRFALLSALLGVDRAQLLARERRLLHQQVAEMMEHAYAHDRETHVAEFAQHYLLSDDQNCRAG